MIIIMNVGIVDDFDTYIVYLCMIIKLINHHIKMSSEFYLCGFSF
jgi:hypothetical protein